MKKVIILAFLMLFIGSSCNVASAEKTCTINFIVNIGPDTIPKNIYKRQNLNTIINKLSDYKVLGQPITVPENTSPDK